MSRTGKPSWRKADDSLWYYWINGKQGYCSGDVWARTKGEARMRIKEKHYNCVIDRVMHYEEYHG